MVKKKNPQAWEAKDIPLQDVVLSNSWALQAILEYLEEIQPGAKERIWQNYLKMKQLAEENPPSEPVDFIDDECDTQPEEDFNPEKER